MAVGVFAFRKKDLVSKKIQDQRSPETQTAKMVIAIDGPAASGKGTLARRIADRFNFEYLDTGSLYRAVALCMVMANGNPDSEIDVKAALNTLGRNMTSELLESPELRSELVSRMSSKVAALPMVREYLLDFQREFAKNPPAHRNGVVLDGRDIGSVVCPNAEVKLFITATAEIRAARRFNELQSKGVQISFDEVLEDIKVRDQRDRDRSASPMIVSDDAFMVDTSDMDIAQTFDHSLNLIRAKLMSDTSE